MLLNPFRVVSNLHKRAQGVKQNNAIRAEIAQTASNIAHDSKLTRDKVLPVALTGLAGLGGATVIGNKLSKPKDYMEYPTPEEITMSKPDVDTANFFLLELGIGGLVGLEGMAASARQAWTRSKLNKNLKGLQAQHTNLKNANLRNTVKNSAIAGGAGLAVGVPTSMYLSNKYSGNPEDSQNVQ